MEPKEGAVYRHFKGSLYQVIGVATHSETMEELIVYRELYGKNRLWVRPKKMFLEKIKRDDVWMDRFAITDINKEE